MADKIAVVNNKGGSTKTTTTVNLAGAYAVTHPSKKVLIVDGDGQGNAGLSFGKNFTNTDEVQHNTTYDILMGNAEAKDCIVNAYANIDIIPANEEMNYLEYDLMALYEEGGATGSITRRYFNMLEDKFDELDKEYDLIIFDTPPEIKSITSSVLSIVDSVIIPYEPDAFAAKGVISMTKRIFEIKNKYNKDLEIAGIMAVKVESRTKTHNEIMNNVMKWAMRNQIYYFQAEMPKSVKFSESVTYRGLPAAIHGRSSRTMSKFVEVYYSLLEELSSNGYILKEENLNA